MRKLLCTLLMLPCFAVNAANKSGKGLDMDYGPFICYSLLRPHMPAVPGVKAVAEKHKDGDPTPHWKAGELIATKGISVKLGTDAAICFDIDTCRYAAAWTGEFVDVSQSNLTRDQGPWPLIVKGALAFTSDDAPGWAKAGSFKDTRHANSDPRLKNGEGPLPRDWAHYRGLYRDGDKAVFEYTVGDVRVLDMPGHFADGGNQVFTRTIRVDASTSEMVMAVGSLEGGIGHAADPTGQTASVAAGKSALYAGVTGAPKGTVLRMGKTPADHSWIELSIPAHPQVIQFTVMVVSKLAGETFNMQPYLPTDKLDHADLNTHLHGGAARWAQEIETPGTVGAENSAYVMDSVSMPNDNPWKCWMKPSGLDFFSDGRAAVCTFSGDVWVVSGLDAKLDHVKWKRFAAGLYEPLGLKIVDNAIYVLDRNGIVKLHDLNNDGEADFYESFNSDMISDANYHSFHMDLQADKEGNFYYAVCGNQMALNKPDQACVIKVSKYGDKAEVFSTGLRAANGLGMGPNDEVTVGDNQGHWVPASPIFLAKAGAFFGYHGDPRRVSTAEFAADEQRRPKNDLPICWVPYPWDNSAGCQVWAEKSWGPCSGHMLHTSYGKCTIFAVLSEVVDGTTQAGVVQIPGKFDSGAMRGRVNPADGQVWIAGMKGWQTNAAKDGSLQRLRYTGKPSYLPTDLHMTTKGVQVTFPVELDPETAKDEGSYTFEVWGYHVSEKYGSDEFKVSNPAVKGHDSLEVKKAVLSADKKSLLIEVTGLKPVTQYILKMKLNAADGSKIKCDIGGSIWKLGTGAK